ncbi:MAG: hypothetical protein ISP53_02385 [Flavobacteriaceae bacterium]|nr:hypothetical protein [Flavobacteriaceae bacterium]
MKFISTIFLLLVTMSLFSQSKVIFEGKPVGIGDNNNSSIFQNFAFDLEEVPSFLVVECSAVSLNLFNSYNALINQRLLKGNLNLEISNETFAYFDTEAKNHLTVNAQSQTDNGEWQSTAKLVFYIPNSYLTKGSNNFVIMNEDNDSRYMDDFFVTNITIHSINKTSSDSYNDYRCNCN